MADTGALEYAFDPPSATVGAPGKRRRRTGAGKPGSSLEDARAVLTRSLEARRAEIEKALLDRLRTVEATADSDPCYLESMRNNVMVTLDYYLAALEGAEEPAVPSALLAQTRRASHAGVGLDTVLQRCFAGRLVLAEFLIDEVERAGFSRSMLRQLRDLQRSREAIFDRMLSAVSEEYTREAEKRSASSEQRRAEQVRKLLAGEMVDTSQFAYDFDGQHLGLIALGSGAEKEVRKLGAALDRRVLCVSADEDTVWAWLGGRTASDSAQVARHAAEHWPDHISLAIGEPGSGLADWRLSHEQASAAMPIILRRRSEVVVRYGEVALLASIISDDLLATSLHRLYLEPLEVGRDGGEVAKETLRAYFDAERNVSAAAANLRISRQAVNSRIRVIEERLGCPLRSCAAEVEAVLRLADLDSARHA
jgi:PucR C-terminal helix-turn-helix domain/GGDEF-like domain